MKNKLHIAVRLLLSILAFQVLNLSINNVQYLDGSYRSSTDTITGFDPTESIIELVVEARYGQQDRFTYKTNPESGKNSGKALCAQVDLISEEPAVHLCRQVPIHKQYFDCPEKTIAFFDNIIVPPPEI